MLRLDELPLHQEHSFQTGLIIMSHIPARTRTIILVIAKPHFYQENIGVMREMFIPVVVV
jgi:hypothetical protein